MYVLAGKIWALRIDHHNLNPLYTPAVSRSGRDSNLNLTQPIRNLLCTMLLPSCPIELLPYQFVSSQLVQNSSGTPLHIFFRTISFKVSGIGHTCQRSGVYLFPQ